MIEIKTVNKGAELVSIKFNGEEIMHDGQSFWNRHAPVLFPIVGKLKDGKTIIDGKVCEMSQHGFARDMDFEKIGDNSYVLKFNEETLKRYPYKFELYISYEVLENKVITRYKVKNIDDKCILFGLGGHPAFKCEYSNGEYYLEFEENENDLEIYQLENGLRKLEPEIKNKFFKDNKILLNKNTFENDALILKNLKSRKVYLKKDDRAELVFEYKRFPYLGIWSKPGAPFVCIEPWFNTTDKVNSTGIFEEKEDIIKLGINEEFESEYNVEFFEN